MKVVVVNLETLTIDYKYDADVPIQETFGGEWGSPQVTVHLEVPEGLDPQCVMAVREGDQVTLVEDPVKVQAKTQQAWTQLRTERNRRLTACDWTQLQDTHLSDAKKSAWADYRQELRDLPDVITDPANVEWPLDPTQTPVVQATGSRADALLSQV